MKVNAELVSARGDMRLIHVPDCAAMAETWLLYCDRFTDPWRMPYDMKPGDVIVAMIEGKTFEEISGHAVA